MYGKNDSIELTNDKETRESRDDAAELKQGEKAEEEEEKDENAEFAVEPFNFDSYHDHTEFQDM